MRVGPHVDRDVIDIDIGIDEDVCKGGGRVADVAGLREESKDPPDHGIRSRWIEIFFVRIDRRIVGFIVDQEHRHIGDSSIASRIRFGGVG